MTQRRTNEIIARKERETGLKNERKARERSEKRNPSFRGSKFSAYIEKKDGPSNAFSIHPIHIYRCLALTLINAS